MSKAYDNKIENDLIEIIKYQEQIIEVVKNGKEFNELTEQQKKSVRLLHKNIKTTLELKNHLQNICYNLTKYENIQF